MPIDFNTLDAPVRFYWPEDPEGKEWIELRLLDRHETTSLFKKANIKQTAEFKVNPQTKQLERVTYLESDLEKDIAFSDLMLDATITNWNFIKPDGEAIPCTKENKIKIVNAPHIRTWIDDCIATMKEGEKKKKEDEEKN